MKGADQCPRCGSRAWIEPRVPSPGRFYSDDARGCRNCGTLWEPFAVADLVDQDEQLSSFHHPCNNCAFRKGSPEQRDPEAFANLRAKLGWHGASFYCHKGVPIDPQNENGFAYPKDGKDPRKLRLCRGYLNQLGNFPLDRMAPADPVKGEPWTDVLTGEQTS